MNISAEESPLVYLCSSVLWTHWNQCKEIPQSLGFLYCVRGGGGGRKGGGREATQADMKSAEAAGRYQWGCQSTHDKSAPVEPESRECRNMCKHLNCNYYKSGIPTSWLTVISEHCWKLIRKLPFIYKYVKVAVGFWVLRPLNFVSVWRLPAMKLKCSNLLQYISLFPLTIPVLIRNNSGLNIANNKLR